MSCVFRKFFKKTNSFKFNISHNERVTNKICVIQLFKMNCVSTWFFKKTNSSACCHTFVELGEFELKIKVNLKNYIVKQKE